ncbi:MAG: hypothetical protein AAF244_02360 [Pseudomonadota bacterium]
MKNLLFIIAALSLPITACGVKPKSVDAPEGAEEVVFPRQYPQKK